jgi:hypothetical protein
MGAPPGGTLQIPLSLGAEPRRRSARRAMGIGPASCPRTALRGGNPQNRVLRFNSGEESILSPCPLEMCGAHSCRALQETVQIASNPILAV